MVLPSELISQFVKITKETKKTPTETTVYGTVVYDGKPYVKLDGSDLLTPISTTTNVADGERVTVMIKDHTAIVTGNMSSPAARTEEVTQVADQVSEFEIVRAHTVTTNDLQAINAIIENLTVKLASIDNLDVNTLNAVTAEIETLKAQIIEGKKLTVEEIDAITATLESIEAKFGTFTDISTEDLEALNAEITNLKVYTGDFTYISALKASIKDLDVKKLSAEDADIKYLNVDLLNVDEAWFDKFYASSGMVGDIVIKDGVAVRELVAVLLKGDMIEAGTLKADRLIVKGSDGEYYRINTDFEALPGVEPVNEDQIHGSTIVAKSITAEKMSVGELAAFEATIGGFHIIPPDTESNVVGALYSGAKADMDNSTPGIYLGQDGQMAVGDMSNYLRFRKVTNENGSERWKLEISADSILFGDENKNSLDDIKKLTEHVKIDNWTNPETGEVNPRIELAEGDSTFRQRITNKASQIMDGDNVVTEMDTEGVTTENVSVRGELRQGQWAWVRHGNGNLGLIWKTEVTE